MKKAAGVFLTSFLFLLPFSFVHAQTAKKAQRWVCLKPVKALSGKGDPRARQTLQTGDVKPLPNAKTYIVECIATDGGQICTTGQSALDMDPNVYGQDNYATLKSKIGFTYMGLYKADGATAEVNPMTSGQDGDLGNVEWESASAHYLRKFLAMNIWDPSTAAVGEQGGQQLGTFDFDTADKDCASISWDPYGRVFDAQTLEPITGAQVTLQFKKGDSYVAMKASDLLGGNLINPQTVGADGAFSFVVPDGSYKLVTVPAPATALTAVDSHYAKAYSDIYPAQTGEEIIQQGAIQHRDIAVPTQNTNKTPKLMEYFYQTTPQGLIIIEGRTSHPLTKVSILTSKITAADPTVKTPYRTVATAQADKNGKFKVEVDQNTFDKTADYTEIFSGVQLLKVDLRQPTAKSLMEQVLGFVTGFIKPVEAAENSVTIPMEPIPQYLEGYAYDANGKAIPNATVSVYLDFANTPYSSVTTDAKGFFKMTSEYLPSYPFELHYKTAAGAVIKVKPSVFLAQNQKYLVSQNINPFVGRDLNNKIAPTGKVPAKAPQTTSPVGNQTDSSSVAATAKSNPTSYAGYILILVVLLLVLVGVAVWLVMHFKKVRMDEPGNLPPPTGV